MGYDTLLFQDDIPKTDADQMTCGVCLQFFKDPIQCTAGHPICSECASPLKKCPHCRKTIKKKKMVPNLTLVQRIDGYTMGCENKHVGCQWSGPPSSYRLHRCGFGSFTCCVPSCDTIISFPTTQAIHNREEEYAKGHAALARSLSKESKKRDRQFNDTMDNNKRLCTHIDAMSEGVVIDTSTASKMDGMHTFLKNTHFCTDVARNIDGKRYQKSHVLTTPPLPFSLFTVYVGGKYYKHGITKTHGVVDNCIHDGDDAFPEFIADLDDIY